MKTMKKTLSLVLAIVMALALAMPAYAAQADNYSLTVNNAVKGHTYTAYQIFKGSKADNTQVQYQKIADPKYEEGAHYYEKRGADYYEVVFDDEAAFDGYEGDLYSRTGNSGLGDVVWGSDITKAGKQALYAAYNMTVDEDKLDDAANIQTLVEKIADVDTTTTSESDKAVKFANVFYDTSANGDVTAKDGLLRGGVQKSPTNTGDAVVFDKLASGYYLVNDSYSPAAGEVNGVDYSIARIAVQVVGNTVINNKADKVEVEKKIKTVDDLYNEKANEVGIGRVVEYEVTQKVPNYDGYNHYYYIIRDKMSPGLTFDPDSVVVKIDNTVISDYHVYSNAQTDADVLNGDTFVIAFDNIMNYEVGKDIVVTYSASVNSQAFTGVDPNTNEVKVDYSNNPTKSDGGDKQGYPGIPASTTDNPLGTTGKTYTDTYTTKLTIHKTDKDGNALKDVEFTLTGVSKDVVLKGETVFELNPAGEYWMLKDGTYTKTAPTTKPSTQPTTGNSGWVVAESTYDKTDVRVVDGVKYRPFVLETDQAKDRVIIVEPNDAAYASTTLKYAPTTTVSADADAVDEYNVTRVGKTDENGDLVFAQLGAGTYTLSETEVLPGYNDISDITFTITCSVPDADKVLAGTEKAEWNVRMSADNAAGSAAVQAETSKVDGQDVPTGNFVITIENNKGTELPSTGGIGTKIFYTMGAVLVIGAGVVLVSRKRAAE